MSHIQELHFIKRLTILGKVIKWMIICFIVISVVAVTIYKFIPVKYPNSVVLQRINHAIDGDTTSVKHKWVPMEEISPYMKYAAVCSEDYAFFRHYGIRITNIRWAIRKNIKAGRIVAGGSTITQQTAKNVFLYPNRTFLRKIMDVWFAFVEELIWGKERIMEIYLNSIEFGKDIYGIECAARDFYGISAKELSLEQCIILSVVIVQPKKHNVNKVDEFMLGRIRHCLKNLHNYHYITEDEFEYMKGKYGVEWW